MIVGMPTNRNGDVFVIVEESSQTSDDLVGFVASAVEFDLRFFCFSLGRASLAHNMDQPEVHWDEPAQKSKLLNI